jgi:hypothetical protein
MDKEIKCKCGWSWLESETEPHDKYICHKCGNNTLTESKLIIKKLLREGLINEEIKILRINDIEDDKVFDVISAQADDLAKNSEIGFGSAEPFGVIINNNELMGATWLETSGNFTFHIIIKPVHRGKGLSKILLDDLMKKYVEKKEYMGQDYKIVVNVVNEKLAGTLAKHYGFKTMVDNGSGVIMTN